jgi:hypothetical protein
VQRLRSPPRTCGCPCARAYTPEPPLRNVG